ncbi:hypothetical protein [Prevotella sp. 10(H)]|uniref:hypothetical protein n=1 Tax=Prevotella sp. 10(H) TaxID=1158294 RepID=UPI0004A727E0|nr:hypothetical protein [Prevotella sp. 10(H)]
MNLLRIITDRIAFNRKSHFWIFFFVLILLSLAMTYLYLPFIPGHDSYFHFRRLQALMDSIGESPFLIYMDYTAIEGYGYFTKGFYPDFVLIPFAIIGKITNLDFAYHFMIFTMTVLCGVFTYIAVNRMYKSTYAASVSAILYTFALYRLLDLFHRGALGEAVSFTFVPLAILGIYEIIKGNYKKWYILTIAFSLLIFNHALSSLLMFITIIILVLVYYKSILNEPKRILYLVISGIITIPIVSYAIFPMMEQLASNSFYYEINPLTSVTENTLAASVIIPGMFMGIIYPMRTFAPAIGLLLTCGIFLRLFVYGKSPRLRSVDIGVIIGLIYVCASSYWFPWTIFPFNKLGIIQIPWRLYEFSSYFFAVAGGYYLALLLKSSLRKFVAGGFLVICTLLVLANDAKLYHDVRITAGIEREASLENLYHLIGLEYLPVKVPSVGYLVERGDSIKSNKGEVNISNFQRDKGTLTFKIEQTADAELELPLIYYKGYTAKLDGTDLSVSESDDGLVQIYADKPGEVKVYYGGTFTQKASWIVTLISIVALCVYIFLFKRKSKTGLRENE